MTVNPIARPSVGELAELSARRLADRAPAVRASARVTSRAHLSALTDPQWDILRMADNPAGCVSQNGSTGVTRPGIRALDAKGYGRAMYDTTRKYLIVGFEINDRGRNAARERFGVPSWVPTKQTHEFVCHLSGEVCGVMVERPNGMFTECGEPVKSPVHDPAAYLAYRAELRRELDQWT